MPDNMPATDEDVAYFRTYCARNDLTIAKAILARLDEKEARLKLAEAVCLVVDYWLPQCHQNKLDAWRRGRTNNTPGAPESDSSK